MEAARATAILGEGGVGLQYYLASELKPGMQWKHALLCTSLDARGQPVKVLHTIAIEWHCSLAVACRCIDHPNATSGSPAASGSGAAA